MRGNMLSLHAPSITGDVVSQSTLLPSEPHSPVPLHSAKMRLSSSVAALKHFLIPDHNSPSQGLSVCSQMQELGAATTQTLMPVQVFG